MRESLRRPFYYLLLATVGLALIPLYSGPLLTRLITICLIYSIAVIGLNLLLGYGGMVSFGHAMFFGIGAYTVALLMDNLGISSIILMLPVSIGLSALVAFAVGLVAVKRRSIYFAMLTMAVGQVGWALVYKLRWLTGGDDGMRMVKMVSLFGHTLEGNLEYFYFVLAVFLICAVVMLLIVKSPFGITLQSIRDSEERTRFIGISVYRHRLVAFVIAGIFAGVAGSLYAPVDQYVTPSLVGFSTSGTMVVMIIFGGMGYFAGPIVGAFVFRILRYYITGFGHWALVMGVVVIGIVLVFPKGLVGGIEILAKKIRGRIEGEEG